MAGFSRTVIGSIASSTVGKLQEQRWFAGKARGVSTFEVRDHGEAIFSGSRFVFLLIHILFRDGGTEDYFIPLSVFDAPPEKTPLSFTVESEGGIMYFEDALFSRQFAEYVMALFRSGLELQLGRGAVSAKPTLFMPVLDEITTSETSVVSSEQSNTSVIIGKRAIYKSYRKVERGENPDYEIPARLAASTGFRSVPKPFGKIDYRNEGDYTIGSLSEFVANEGDCWTYFTGMLGKFLKNAKADDVTEEGEQGRLSCLYYVRKLGGLTARLHNSLSALDTEQVFAPVPVTREDISRWVTDYSALTMEAVAALRGSSQAMSVQHAALAHKLLGCSRRLLDASRSATAVGPAGMHRIRVHGDYHLGQVLKAGEEFYVIDFEGEPMRSLEYRRSAHCALRDVSGMLRSLDYAASFSERRLGSDPQTKCVTDIWRSIATGIFMDSYWSNYAPSVQYLPSSFNDMKRLLTFFTIEKAVYELKYEMNNRPEWVDIPLNAILTLLGDNPAQTLNKDAS